MDTRLNGTVTALRMAIVTILAIRPSLGAFVASVWLLLIAANLVLGGHFDIAVRDVVLAVSAFALARFEQARAGEPGQVQSVVMPLSIS